MFVYIYVCVRERICAIWDIMGDYLSSFIKRQPLIFLVSRRIRSQAALFTTYKYIRIFSLVGEAGLLITFLIKVPFLWWVFEENLLEEGEEGKGERQMFPDKGFWPTLWFSFAWGVLLRNDFLDDAFLNVPPSCLHLFIGCIPLCLYNHPAHKMSLWVLLMITL